jgi:hypothetical protein
MASAAGRGGHRRVIHGAGGKGRGTGVAHIALDRPHGDVSGAHGQAAAAGLVTGVALAHRGGIVSKAGGYPRGGAVTATARSRGWNVVRGLTLGCRAHAVASTTGRGRYGGVIHGAGGERGSAGVAHIALGCSHWNVGGAHGQAAAPGLVTGVALARRTGIVHEGRRNPCRGLMATIASRGSNYVISGLTFGFIIVVAAGATSRRYALMIEMNRSP